MKINKDIFVLHSKKLNLYYEIIVHNYDKSIASIHYKYNGSIFRFGGGPAVIYYYESGRVKTYRYYDRPGVLYRGDDLPAIIDYSDDKRSKILSEYYFNSNGKSHRDYNLPSVIEYNRNGTIKNQFWYKNGRLIASAETG